MACSINKTKYLYWCMMLAMIVVLIWVHNGPKIMVKMIVADSSATQHTSSEKRQLRSSSYMTAKINGGEEERVLPDLVLPDLNLPALSEDVTEAIKIGEEHVATMSRVDENAKSFEKAGLLEWFKDLEPLSPQEQMEAASSKLEGLLSLKTEEEVLRIIRAAKNDPATKKAADSLEIAVLRKWISKNREDDIFEMLLAGKEDLSQFLANPLLNTWIKFYEEQTNESPYSRLLDKLTIWYDEGELAHDLLLAQGDDATSKTAKTLASLQLFHWRNQRYSGEVVFKHLKLNFANINVFDHPLWDMWMAYMEMLYANQAITLKEVAKILKKNFDDNVLFDWLAAVKTEEAKKRAAYIETVLKKTLKKKRKAPETTSRQRNHLSTKSQRKGDDK